jgi:hypothetical protein
MANIIIPPRDYQEWVNTLNELAEMKNDSQVLTALRGGTLAWHNKPGEQLIKQLIEIVNYRINVSMQIFFNDLNNAKGVENEIVNSLSKLRNELSFLSKALNLPAFPQVERIKLHKSLLGQADNVQNSIEEAAKADKSGKMEALFKKHKVNVML